MKTRAITGIFFCVVMLASMLLTQEIFAAFFTLLSIWCTYEFYGIIRNEQQRPDTFLGLTVAAVIMTTSSFYLLGYIPGKYMLLSIPLVLAIYLKALFDKRSLPFNDIAITFLGILYVILPFLSFLGLGFIQGRFQAEIPVGFMLLLWTSDTGAYLAGRSLGKHKLFERISPKKTWEGFAGGIVLALVVGYFLAQNYPILPLELWLSMAVLIACFGTLGDLVESMLKRSLNVKDSGTILPGHGGLLDRFDGLLVAAPLVYILLKFMEL
ncbi:phosphatidate cytidylyltransferase [Sphingobacteriaceae bacterium WQ 2009]|uniref:Phosphatidate cytidylyltransferase n=1 Tax=Rhinopithecimicrobium faecis TaxID=2820698 RepID=A0A8T4HBB1_9SPHI|nr:phosphatidate cytidylyltransferase [Sphingobacteriaceae bacterium WQ 2009]